MLALVHDTAVLLAEAAGLEKYIATAKNTANRPAQLYYLAALRAYGALAKSDTDDQICIASSNCSIAWRNAVSVDAARNTSARADACRASLSFKFTPMRGVRD